MGGLTFDLVQVGVEEDNEGRVLGGYWVQRAVPYVVVEMILESLYVVSGRAVDRTRGMVLAEKWGDLGNHH